MSATAARNVEQAARYLGPARVLRAGAGRVAARLDDGREVDARLALACPYRPTAGDEVLVIGGADHFVIGVLKGRGRLALEGRDLGIHAERGRLRLSAAAIHVDAPVLRLFASDVVAVHAASLLKQVSSLRTLVQEKASLLGRDVDQLVRGPWRLRARRVVAKVKNTFFVNGTIVRLG